MANVLKNFRSQAETPEAETLTYATPSPRPGSGLGAGVWITIAGLALIFLGGCFCIGIMISLNVGNTNVAGIVPGSASSHFGFIILLYILAFACFGSAAFVLFLGIRRLLAIGS